MKNLAGCVCMCNSIYDDEEHKGENVLKHMSELQMTDHVSIIKLSLI